jgi:hypothetical protein
MTAFVGLNQAIALFNGDDELVSVGSTLERWEIIPSDAGDLPGEPLWLFDALVFLHSRCGIGKGRNAQSGSAKRQAAKALALQSTLRPRCRPKTAT